MSDYFILGFLEHRGLDYQHRSLHDVWAFNDTQIEYTHDFIQWIFPLTEPSQNILSSPVLCSNELALVVRSLEANKNILLSANWFLCFLERNENWRTRYDHNHLRVSRLLKSLMLINKYEDARLALNRIMKILGPQKHLIDSKAQIIWKKTVEGME